MKAISRLSRLDESEQVDQNSASGEASVEDEGAPIDLDAGSWIPQAVPPPGKTPFQHVEPSEQKTIVWDAFQRAFQAADREPIMARDLSVEIRRKFSHPKLTLIIGRVLSRLGKDGRIVKIGSSPNRWKKNSDQVLKKEKPWDGSRTQSKRNLEENTQIRLKRRKIGSRPKPDNPPAEISSDESVAFAHIKQERSRMLPRVIVNLDSDSDSDSVDTRIVQPKDEPGKYWNESVSSTLPPNISKTQSKECTPEGTLRRVTSFHA